MLCKSPPFNNCHTLKDTFFNKAILGQILADRLKEMTAGSESVREEIATLRAEVAKLDASLERLLDAIEEGGDAKSIMPRMRATERERDAGTARLEHLDGLLRAAGTFDPVQWMADISALLATIDVSFGIAVAPEGDDASCASACLCRSRSHRIPRAAGRTKVLGSSSRKGFSGQ